MSPETASFPTSSVTAYSDLRERVETLRQAIIRASAEPELLARLHPAQQAGAANLAHYLALRQFDLRSLQSELARLGVSSLGRAEGHVLATLNAIATVLAALDDAPPPALTEPPVDFDGGQARLDIAANRLLGPAPAGRDTRIMVTMPSEAATDRALVANLIAVGMDIARINAAHDDRAAWQAMAENVRAAAAAANRACKIIVDLPGPKLRTGPIEPGPQVLKVRPKRNALGDVIEPGMVLFSPEGETADPSLSLPSIPVNRNWLEHLETGHRLSLHDTRGRKREIEIGQKIGDSRVALTDQTIYFVPGMELHADGKHSERTVIGQLPAKPNRIPLTEDELLVLITADELGHPARYDDSGELLEPARISCSLGDDSANLRTGERIWFDDGLIGGVIERVLPGEIHVRITQTPPGGAKLASEKGINLPDSELSQSAFTAEDREILAFAVEHADLIDYSFVRRESDITDLLQALRELNGEHLGIVLKIETRHGFEALPDLLRAAFASDTVGVMIARGDLAVECGFARLAEVQEEILWLCEAAHVPVIWATQVLESLAKLGQPSRAEITDAAMGQRAECVMLNKGPEIEAAVHALDDILRRMEAHQNKKRTLLRKLNAWD